MKYYCLIVLALCGAAQGQVSLGGPGEQFPSATTDGAWCWYQDPRAIYYKGAQEKTYIGFIDKSGTTKAWSYDHKTGETAQSAIHSRLQFDDHNAPSLYVRKDGRIIAFYSRHTSDKNLFYRTTANPEDITNWEPEKSLTLPANVTYSHAFRLSSENKSYLFTRCIDWHPTMLRSSDDGATWGSPVALVGGGGARPYIKFVSDEKSSIHFAFTDGHPRDERTNSIYYAYYEGGNFYKADGTVIKDIAHLPIEPSEAEKVYDGSTKGKAWIWDISLDKQNHPVMVFAVFPDDSNHHYYYARWTGSKWFVKDMVNAGKWFPQTPSGKTEPEPNYSPGISLDHSDPSVAYLSRFVNGQTEIERWTTSDGGSTWASTKITSGSSKRNARPILPWPKPFGSQPPAKELLFWMNGDYTHYTNYGTGIKYCELAVPTRILPRPAAFENRLSTDSKMKLYLISGKQLQWNNYSPYGSLSSFPSGLYFMRKGRKTLSIIDRSGEAPSIPTD